MPESGFTLNLYLLPRKVFEQNSRIFFEGSLKKGEGGEQPTG